MFGNPFLLNRCREWMRDSGTATRNAPIDWVLIGWIWHSSSFSRGEIRTLRKWHAIAGIVEELLCEQGARGSLCLSSSVGKILDK